MRERESESVSEIVNFQDLRLAKMRRELQEEIDITLAWIAEKESKWAKESESAKLERGLVFLYGKHNI